FSSHNNVSSKSNITDFNIILSSFIIYLIFLFLLYYGIYNLSLSPSFFILIEEIYFFMNLSLLNLKRSILYFIIFYILFFCNLFKVGLFMLTIERINRIKEIVTDKQTIKISELSKILNVSEMTIHRDLKPLIADGYLFKTFGGVSLTNEQSDKQNNTDQCVI